MGERGKGESASKAEGDTDTGLVTLHPLVLQEPSEITLTTQVHTPLQACTTPRYQPFLILTSPEGLILLNSWNLSQ